MPPSRAWRTNTLVACLVVTSGCGARDGSEVARALAEGRAEDAWRLSGAAVRADSSSAAAWTDRARAGLATGRTKAGLEAASRAIELTGDAHAYLVRAYLEQQRFRNIAAIAAADTARQLAPGDLRCLRAAGELRFGGGMVGVPDHTGAIEIFRAVLARDSADVRSRFGLGKALVLTGRGAEGARWLSEVVEEWPAWAEAHYLLGLTSMRGRDFTAAVARFDSALAFDPTLDAASFNRARVLDRLGHPAEAAAARERADALRDLTGWTRLTAENWHTTGSVRPGTDFAQALRAAGRWREAAQVARTLTIDFPGVPAGFVELAEATLVTGDAEVARGAAEEAAKLAPGQVRPYLLKARADEMAGRTAAALESAREASSRDPADPEAAALLAHLLVLSGDAAGAIPPLDEAVRRGARDVRIAASRAEAFLALGRPREAVALLGRMLETQWRPEWLQLRARARQETGASAAARDDLRAALEVEPRRSACWQALADLLESLGQGQEATECRERAARIGREDESARRALAAWEGAPYDELAAAEAVRHLIAAGRHADAGRVTLRAVGTGTRP